MSARCGRRWLYSRSQSRRSDCSSEGLPKIEGESPVELVLVGAVAALDLAVGLRAARRDVFVLDAKVMGCHVKSVAGLGSIVVRMVRIATGRRCRISSVKSLAERIELWS